MEFRIAKIPYNWALQELMTDAVSKKDGSPIPDYWVNIGYYGKLRDLAAALLNRSIIVPDGTLTEQIPALIEAIKEAETRLESMLSKEYAT